MNNNVLNDFYFYLKKNFRKSSLIVNYDLSKCSSIGTGGKAVLFVKVFRLDELIFLMRELNDRKIKYKVIGQCTNLVFRDEGFEGVVLKLYGSFFKKIKIMKDGILCGCAVSAESLVKYACKYGIAGFEFLTGIPGTLGGIIKTNAGSFGKDVSHILKKIYAVDNKGRIIEMDKKDLIFQYRKTKNIGNKIVFQALLVKRKGDCKKIVSTVNKYRKIKASNQPKGRTVGSVFKNPPNEYAWRLIDKCGFRGVAEGGIIVSQKHPNWFVNVKNGKTNDIVHLIKKIKSKVKRKFGVNLELEIELVKK